MHPALGCPDGSVVAEWRGGNLGGAGWFAHGTRSGLYLPNLSRRRRGFILLRYDLP